MLVVVLVRGNKVLAVVFTRVDAAEVVDTVFSGEEVLSKEWAELDRGLEALYEAGGLPAHVGSGEEVVPLLAG